METDANMYTTKRNLTDGKRLNTKNKNINSDVQPEIKKNEIKKTIIQTKNNKSPSINGITVELLNNTGKTTNIS